MFCLVCRMQARIRVGCASTVLNTVIEWINPISGHISGQWRLASVTRKTAWRAVLYKVAMASSQNVQSKLSVHGIYTKKPHAITSKAPFFYPPFRVLSTFPDFWRWDVRSKNSTTSNRIFHLHPSLPQRNLPSSRLDSDGSALAFPFPSDGFVKVELCQVCSLTASRFVNDFLPWRISAKPQSLVKSVSVDAWLSWSNLSSAAERVKSLFIILAPHPLIFNRNDEYLKQGNNLEEWLTGWNTCSRSPKS